MKNNSEKIRVFRLIGRLNVGGPAKLAILLSEKMDKNKFIITLVTGVVEDNEDDMLYYAEERNIKPVIIPEMKRSISLDDFYAIKKIHKLIREFNPDIIDTNTSKAGFIGGFAGWLYNLERFLSGKKTAVIIHTFHGHTFSGYFGFLKSKLFLSIERFLSIVPLARKKNIVISCYQLREIKEFLKFFKIVKFIPDKKFSVIPVGIDLAPYSCLSDNKGKLRKEFGISDNTLVIGIVGRLTSIKNHEMFLNAASAVKSEFYKEKNTNNPKKQKPFEIKFIIIGNGELKEDLEKQCEKLDIKQDVIFTGHRSDIHSLYADIDIVGLTSRNEGTPLSLLEAMACGISVVATDVGGVREILTMEWEKEEGEWKTADSSYPRGLLVEPDSVEDFAKALIKLIEDSELRNLFGKNGMRYTGKYHHMDRMVKDTEELFINSC